MPEYHVKTECGRNFAWMADDMDDLFRKLTHRSYFAKKVQLLEDYDPQFKRRDVQV